MLNKTKLQKIVEQQRKALKELLSESMAEVAAACSEKIHDRQALEKILTCRMSTAEYCKYVWVLDKTGLQVTDNVKRIGLKHGQVGRDRVSRPYLQRALGGKDYYLSDAYISRNRKRPSITAVKIIYDKDGQVSGYLGADFDLRELPHTADVIDNKKIWQQVKGDPAIRSGLFSQQRVKSAMDTQIDKVLSVMKELMLGHGIFHAKFHFSSSRATLWRIDNPFDYQILNIDELSDPDICLAFQHQKYFEKATVNAKSINKIFQQFKDLRFADETIYLRSASLNSVNGMVGLNFSCDGSHYMHHEEFLEKNLTFWFGG
ncbi:MAG: PDC sensor domain-containing protein [Anaerolineae bacterium]|nr:PDC sensor domain-containing protein [Anaerolineae bacterium]